MADSAAVARVSGALPDEAATSFGFDGTTIGALLDSGASETKAILAGWRVVAAKAAAIENVVENGSSRTGALFTNAQAMITFWQGQSDKEDVGNDATPRFHGASRTSVRV
jgi:hypothetical protein